MLARLLLIRGCLPLAAALVLPRCASAQAAGGPRPIAPPARAFLAAALDSMERLSRHRDTVDWRALRDSVFRRAGGAEVAADTYGALFWALQRVDEHSYLAVAYDGVRERLVRGRFGYLRVPQYAGPSQAPLADSLQLALRRLDRAGACGWIVDLRGNTGGNMWPMLAGIGPLLAADDVGAAMLAGHPNRWRYRDGAAAQVAPDGAAVVNARVTGPPHVLRDPQAPVAVLIDGRTLSSGEVIAVAFRGRPATRFFGRATGGYSTVNRNVPLGDGIEIYLTVGVYADRTGRTYGGPIEPDEAIPGYTTYYPSPVDPVAARAADWLAGQPACAK